MKGYVNHDKHKYGKQPFFVEEDEQKEHEKRDLLRKKKESRSEESRGEPVNMLGNQGIKKIKERTKEKCHGQLQK